MTPVPHAPRRLPRRGAGTCPWWLAAAAVLAAGCQPPPAAWSTLADRGGGYSVELPGRPQAVPLDLAIRGQAVRLAAEESQADGLRFRVASGELSADQLDALDLAPELLVEAAAEACLADRGGTRIDLVPHAFREHAGCQQKSFAPAGGQAGPGETGRQVVYERIYLVGRRLLLAQVRVPEANLQSRPQATGQAVARFLDSFQPAGP